MQSLGKFLFCAGLGILANCNLALAQDSPKPIAIQVVIGADGSVKVIDAKTGKALDDAAIKLLAKPGAVEIQKLDKKKIEDVQKAIDKLIELEFNGKPDAKPEPKAKSKPFELEFDLQLKPLPDAEQFEKLRIELEKLKQGLDKKEGLSRAEQQARIAVARALEQLKERQARTRPQPADSVDKKLDLILKQLEDLRKDVDGIKNKLDSKKPDGIEWRVVPGGKPRPDGTIELEIVPVPGKDKKPGDPKAQPNPDEVRKRLDDLIKELEEKERNRPRPLQPRPSKEELERELKRAIEALKEAERKLSDRPIPLPVVPKQENVNPQKKIVIELPKTIDRNAQLERRIESLLREVDELRREIERAKKSPK